MQLPTVISAAFWRHILKRWIYFLILWGKCCNAIMKKVVTVFGHNFINSWTKIMTRSKPESYFPWSSFFLHQLQITNTLTRMSQVHLRTISHAQAVLFLFYFWHIPPNTQDGWGWKGPLSLSHPTPWAAQGLLPAQHDIQTAFQDLWDWKPHNLFEQPIPVLDHLHIKWVFPEAFPHPGLRH